MTRDDTRNYHLAELRIAQDASAPGHILPAIPAGCRAVLDLGCGAGQSLIASRIGRGVLACGVDPDIQALKLGRELTGEVRFAAALAETLPFANASFDLVFSRVALPYTHIPHALSEIARVLQPGGTVWLTLHHFAFARRNLLHAVRTSNLRALLFNMYVAANGLLLHFIGRQVRWPLGERRRCESVQTRHGMQRTMARAGLSDIQVHAGKFFIVTARKPSQ